MTIDLLYHLHTMARTKQVAGVSREKSTPRVKLMYSAPRKSVPAAGGVKYCKIQALSEISKFQKSAESHL